MPWITTITLIGLFAVVMLAGFLMDAQNKRRDAQYRRSAREYMSSRRRRSALEFGREFYPDRPEVASEIRDLLAKHIPIDLAQLEPSDQPVQDLHMDDLDSMATTEFLMDIEDRFGIKIEESAAIQMRTVDDIVRYVIAKIDQKELENLL